MRILTNENFPRDLVRALRDRGHDVVWVRESFPGSSDEIVLGRAQTENRIVATFDKGFGEMAFRWGLPATSGVILLRLSNPNPETVVENAVRAIESRKQWEGQFATITDHQIRVRPLPGAS